MNINNFEEYIDKRILSRGYDYYVEGNIIETREGVDGEFILMLREVMITKFM